MIENGNGHLEKGSTRRTILKGAGCAGIGALAGCVTEGNNDEKGPSEGYSVTMDPVGTVEFDSVPETWVANNGSWADMGIALGQDPPEAVWLTERYHTQYYDEISGVSVDKSDMISLSQDGVDKEYFYELNGDVHVIDPYFLMNRFDGWSEDDIDEVERLQAPFFGNSIFSTGYDWHDYPYFSLYEAFEYLAELFQERERYEAFESLHDEFQSNVEEIVPPADDRPSVAIMWASGDEPDSFSPYLIGDGTSFKQWRDLGVVDALAETDVEDFHASRGEIDYEMLYKIDPDVILLRGQEAKTEDEFEDTVVSYMENDNTARDLAAVTDGNVFRGGSLYQGPITNLILTERGAQQVYDVGEELFDREKVSDIVNGEL